jgi:chromosomal replication initiator protein
MTDVMTFGPVLDIVKQSEAAIKEISGVTVKLMPVECYHSSFKDINSITDLICAALDQSPEKIKSKTRKREVVLARQLISWHATMYTNLKLKDIGEELGGQDHTTVIHSRDTIDDLLSSEDYIVLDAMNRISNEIIRRNEIHTRREPVSA